MAVKTKVTSYASQVLNIRKNRILNAKDGYNTYVLSLGIVEPIQE